uniref:Uncharacterized protein n=1 Tax=Setaria italica TaxID=4555 RepID=K3XTI9_SETIT
MSGGRKLSGVRGCLVAGHGLPRLRLGVCQTVACHNLW